MAINPNTDFSSGAVLTAAQQNRFPRGVMAYAQTTTSDATITVEEIEVTPDEVRQFFNKIAEVRAKHPALGNKKPGHQEEGVDGELAKTVGMEGLSQQFA